jgi:hypothetical protein
MKSEVDFPVAYAMHDSPERFIPFPGTGVSIAAGLPTARDTAGYRIFAITDAGPTLNCATACCTNSPERSNVRSVCDTGRVRTTVGYGV